MSDYVTRIRTTSGDLQIDYNALANLPNYKSNPLPVECGGTGAKTIEEARRNIGAAYAEDVKNHINNNSNPHNVTASDVKARPNTWMPTASEVGAAPAGYGLGGNATTVTSADDISANGYYETAVSVGGYTASCIIWHNQHSTNYAEQYAISVLGACVGSILHRVKIQGDWQPWEFINPPMSYRVEYRTTERYNGKAVYVQLLSIGVLSSVDFTKVDNIAEGVDRIFYTDLIIKEGAIGAINPTGHRISLDYLNNVASVSIFPDGEDVYGGKSAYLYVKYTKL